MIGTNRLHRLFTLSIVLTMLFSVPLTGVAQNLIAVSSITGGSSVFVFRNIVKAMKKVVAVVRPARSKVARIETVKKIKRQYETLAKVTPRRPKASVVDPAKTPISKALPPTQGSIRFAGVGEFYLGKGDLDLAFEAFLDALRLDENNALAKTGYSEALAAKGNELLLNDRADQAKGMFLESLKFDPKNAAAYFGLGEAYTDLKENDQAIANYELALEGDKALTEIYVPLGILYFQNGNIAKADELLSKSVAATPDSPETQFFLGLVRMAQDKDEEALTALTKAKTLDPTNAEAFFNSGEVLLRLKRVDAAIPDYQKATELKPSHFDAWFGLGEAHFALNDYPKAITAYTAAAKLKNTDWQVFQGLAESFRLNSEFEKAEANYRLAGLFISREKEIPKAKVSEFNSKIGLVIGQQCDINSVKRIRCNWSDAIDALQKAATETQDPVDYVNLGWAYFRAGHEQAENRNMPVAKPFLDNAKVALEKAVAAGPPAEDFALQNLASVYIDLGDNKGAIETLNKLIQKRPDLDFANYALGVAYFKSGDFGNAEKWFRTAIDKDPKNVTYFMALGNALISKKDGKGLKTLIDRLRAIDPAAANELDAKRQAFRM